VLNILPTSLHALRGRLAAGGMAVAAAPRPAKRATFASGRGTLPARLSLAMHVHTASARLTRLAKTTIGLELLLAAGAIGGGIALMAGPRGQILPLPVSSLSGSPFADYFWPGVVLFVAIGVFPLAAAALSLRRHPAAPAIAIATGVSLLGWLAVEIAIIGYSSNPPLQPFYLVLGVVICAVSGLWLRESRPG
jgi:hypothetical protein